MSADLHGMPPISRRDFLNGAALAVAAPGVLGQASLAASPYPPLRTGLQGQTDAVSAAAHGLRDEPPRWRDAKSKLELSTPLNFVYTADTIGGCSGSPVITRNGEIVGINFDSNVQKLPNRYLYIDENEGSRAVGVHTSAIVEALQKLYGADELVKEIKRR